jgi:hypothetical protein
MLRNVTENFNILVNFLTCQQGNVGPINTLRRRLTLFRCWWTVQDGEGMNLVARRGLELEVEQGLELELETWRQTLYTAMR